MPRAAVVFDHVWKKFRRGERHDSLRDLVPALSRRLLGRGRTTDLGEEEFWALEDVSFEVRPGEALGVIGPNGAGKSTMLKLLSRILRPTRGTCEVRGRVGALIEVAAGFHPDLTGRENIYLQGAIMGMKRAQITRTFDAIVDFAGIGAFIDTPVKRYSSGMHARLGFSIAAHLDPGVLLVDEILSVGDVTFQSRCLAKMADQIAGGMTLVFVSHNLPVVARLCQRAVVLGGGRCLFDGAPEAALQHYLAAAGTGTTVLADASEARLRLSRAVFRHDGGDLPLIRPHASCELTVDVECLRQVPAFCLAFEVERSRDLLYCFGTTSQELGTGLFRLRPGEVLRVRFRFTAHLTRGHYRVNINCWDPAAGSSLLHCFDVTSFSMDERISHGGVADIELETRRISHGHLAEASA